MIEDGTPDHDPPLSLELALAFAPLHKRAFGIAVGSAAGLFVLALTLASIVLDPAARIELELLAQYFYGYRVSVVGALIGSWWGFMAGFVAGWFVAFVRNLVLAAAIFVSRTRDELAATRDFLDHV